MAQLALGAVGAVLGTFVGMPQLGFAIGSAIGGALFAPTQKVQGPKLGDLKAPSATYGSTIPYIEGHPRFGGIWVWQSNKREIENTENQGGKGGPKVESTTYTYEMDVLIVLTEGPFAGVRKCWSNGKLIWTAADDADEDSLEASSETDAWRELRQMRGLPGQMPDPTYEAAVGVGNAPAMRDRGCVFIEGLNLGGSGQPPVLTWEVCSQASETEELDVLFDVPYSSGFNDISTNPITPVQSSTGSITLINDRAVFEVIAEHGAHLIYAGSKFAFDLSKRFTIEAVVSVGATRGSGTGDNDRFLLAYSSGGQLAFGYRVISGIVQLTSLVQTNVIGVSTEIHGPPNSSHYRIVIEDGVARFWNGGSLLRTVAYPGFFSGIQVGVSSIRSMSTVMSFSVDFVRAYYGDVPVDTTLISLDDIPLDEVVSRQCIRGGLTESQVDVAALEGQFVRALAVTQITSPRNIIETLMAAHFFEAVEEDKLRFVMRGGAVAATIPFEDLGAAKNDGAMLEPFPLTSGNDTEVPQQVTVKFSNVENDYQDGVEGSDRLYIGGTGVDAVELPLGLTPLEAKQIASKRVTDYGASMIRVGPIALDRTYTALQPTDVVLLTDESGSTFRARLLKRTDADGVLTFEGVLDDATVMSSNAVTSGGYNSSTLVRRLVDTEIELLDIPILRDVDNDQGFYVAAKPETEGTWPGAAVFKSSDDLAFGRVAEINEAAVFGSCVTTLGDWTGGRVFDEKNRLTVNVGQGTLSGSTRDALLNNAAVNACAVGVDGRWEICQFRDAELVGEGIYILSGFLRGSRGTEWAMSEHEASERFVLLTLSGIRRVVINTSELGALRYYKGVTFNKSLASATSEEFIDYAVGLKPFSPFDVRGVHEATGDIELTWQRRSRMAARAIGPLGISVPLGEQAELYDIEIFEDNNYGDVVRTITASTTSATYLSAQQIADFGSEQAVVYVKVYQVSDVVGRGYEVKAAA